MLLIARTTGLFCLPFSPSKNHVRLKYVLMPVYHRIIYDILTYEHYFTFTQAYFFSLKQVLWCFSTVYSSDFFLHKGSSIQNDGLLFFPLSNRQTCLMSSASLSDCFQVFTGSHTVFLAVKTRTIEPSPPMANAFSCHCSNMALLFSTGLSKPL